MSTLLVCESSTNIAAVCQRINSESPEERSSGTTMIRQMFLMEPDPPAQRLIESACPVLLRFLDDSHASDALQYECARALANIASSSRHIPYLINLGVAGAFLRKLEGMSARVFGECLRGLGNIAGDSLQHRDDIITQGVIPLLCQCFRPTTPQSVHRNSARLALSLCRDKPLPALRVIRQLLTPLLWLIYSDDQEILANTCQALAAITDEGSKRIEAVVEVGLPHRLVELLPHPSPAVSVPALKCIGNILSGDERCTQAVLDNGPLPSLRAMFTNPDTSIRKGAVFAVSNITAGTVAQIQAVLDAGMLADLLGFLEMVDDPETKSHAIWALRNAASGGSPAQIHMMVEAGLIRAFVRLLGSPMILSRPKLQRVILVALQDVLKSGNSLARVHQQDGREYVRQLIGADAVSVLRRLVEVGSSDYDDGESITTLAQTLLRAVMEQPPESERSRSHHGNNNNNNEDDDNNNNKEADEPTGGPESNNPNHAISDARQGIVTGDHAG
ncbi:putative Importin subunit alpha-1a [Paratrimastix pyriformis]|uniref:Importin subunit alpha n=1 Tax=Paratrimastix pyriformis TaxID=342808 RepID=A0ABQ8UTT1_9EUKA|nr:putative Importin subunit alpha-1a [Paratrimastix pyriformis]